MSPPIRSSLLALALLTAACSRGPKQAGFVDGLFAAVPEPEAGAYPTPERVVTRFFEAVSDGDPDAALRCFPIRAYHAAYDVETHFALTGSYDLTRRVPMPAGVDELQRGLIALIEYAQQYSRFRRLALPPGAVGLTISRDDADWRARLDEVKALKITGRYAVTVLETRDASLDALDTAMKVEARKLLLVEVKLGDRELPPQIAAVGKIGADWRILNLVDR